MVSEFGQNQFASLHNIEVTVIAVLFVYLP